MTNPLSDIHVPTMIAAVLAVLLGLAIYHVALGKK